MNIRGYLPTSLNEWPGKVSAVIWVAGCNFRCPFCDNRDLILHPEKLPSFSEKEILAGLKQRKKWLDAVCITGGEPTLQPDLEDFLEKIKKIGLLVMLETNGTNPKALQKFFKKKLLDRLSMDVKGPVDKRYAQIAGMAGQKNFDLASLRYSIRIILKSGVDFEFRTTVVPTLHTKESLVELAQQLKKIAADCQSGLPAKQAPVINRLRWVLQQFVPQNCINPFFEKIKPFSQAEMKEILEAVKKYIPQVRLRGV